MPDVSSEWNDFLIILGYDEKFVISNNHSLLFLKCFDISYLKEIFKVFIFRHDICANDEDGCGLMGLAYVAAACTDNENCCINEDGGLVLGVVVAHEMGHV